MADNIFGLDPAPEVDDSDYADDPVDPVVEEAAPEEETQEVEAEPGAPEEVTDTPPVEAPAPPEEEPEAPPIEVETLAPTGTPVPDFIAQDRDLGKFKTIEALAEGYSNVLALHNRTAQRAREAESNAAEWERMAQESLRMLQAREAAPAPVPAPGQLPPDIAALAAEAGVDENTLRVAQALINRSNQGQATQAQQEQMQRDLQLRQEYAQRQLTDTVNDFFTRHPEVTQGSDVDQRLGYIVALTGLDPSYPDSLEAAYEVVSDPDLEKYVRANPHTIASDEGLAYAREQIALNKRLEAAASTHTAAQTEAARQAALRNASVETGSGTPPTSPGGENDEWAQVLAVARRDRGAEDIFGLGTTKP